MHLSVPTVRELYNITDPQLGGAIPFRYRERHHKQWGEPRPNAILVYYTENHIIRHLALYTECLKK